MSQSAILARLFEQNWMNRHPQDAFNNGLNLDDSLTSLGWLQNLRVSEFVQTRQTHNPVTKSSCNRSLIKQELGTSNTSLSYPQYQELDPDLELDCKAPVCGNPHLHTDHKTNPYVKPPYSYASLICMAMKSTCDNRLTLASIYSWITENFIYYRLSDPSWQNSIRHNLSLNKCFQKVARRKDEPGKGGFWTINPEYCDLTDSPVFKKRQGSRDNTPSPPLKRLKLEEDGTLRIFDRKKRREDTLLSNCSRDFDTNEEDSENSLTLKGDLNWTNILSQDIEICGQTVKTEDILDECKSSSFLPMSPPYSETNSDDLGIDFLSQTGFSMNLSSDFQTNDPLDLTVQGTIIRPPEWWSADDNSNMINTIDNNNSESSGLNTPVPTSPESEHEDIFWGENLKLGSSGSSFDLDSLFSFDKIPTSKQ